MHMDNEHKQKVDKLSIDVKEFYKNKTPFRIFHGSTNSTKILKFKRDRMLDISNLNNVISIDEKNRIAIVEPNVPMDLLVKETLKHGLIPPVVPEFPGITVGGAIQGGAGESSSFKYGCFNQTCISYEIIQANGKITNISVNKNHDLFYGMAGSFGTLGVIIKITIQLIPAKKYVNLKYLPIKDFSNSINIIKSSIADYDFVDGIVFSKNEGCIIVGKLSDKKLDKKTRFSRSFDNWYYLHVKKISKNTNLYQESVPIKDYLFRYDRGAFWVGTYAFEMFNVPFNRFYIWLLNPLLHTRKLYQALQESGASQQHVVQDLALPESKAVEFMNYIDKEFDIYPIWLCPIKPEMSTPFLSNSIDTPLVINVGVWGNVIESRTEFLHANKQIESKLTKLNGKKWFYAHSYYTEEEFWKIYDKDKYLKLRKKYHATHLPNIYDKVVVKESYEINKKRGALKTLFGMAKLRIE